MAGIPAEELDLTPDLLASLEADERDLVASSNGRSEAIDALRLVADAAFVRRVTVLARSAPLHDMEGRESRQQFAADRYDLRSLALAALDAVVVRQGLDEEATSEDVLDLLRRLAQRAAGDLPAADHLAVARFVLQELLNDREGGAAFVVHYSDYRDAHRRVPLQFHIFEEGVSRHGQVVLRASVPAITTLICGLDFEVEDFQVAMDAMLRHQVTRGEWGRAEESATRSLLLSVAMAEKVRGLLAETERDVGSVDWAERIPSLLERAQRHLEERQRAEDLLMTWMRGARNDASDEEIRATCVRILALLMRCYNRHRELHTQILRARDTFLSAQAAQRFRPLVQLRSVAMAEEVLGPVARMGTADAAEIAALFADAVAGPVVTRLPLLPELYRLLLAPVREPGGVVPDDGQPELADVDGDGLQPFTEAECEAARAVLSLALARPCRLSQLLAEARPHGPVAVDLVALTVLWAFAPEDDDDDTEDEIPAEFEDLFSDQLVVLSDQTPLQFEAYTGDDLLIVPVPAAGAEPSGA